MSQSELKVLSDHLTDVFKKSLSDLQTSILEQQEQQAHDITAIHNALDTPNTNPFSKGPAGFSRAPTFSGKENAFVFMNQFNLYGDLYQWDDEQRLMAFPLTLTGLALIWYTNLDKTQIHDFKALQDLFFAHFQSATDNWLLRQELATRSLKPNETLDEYSADIQSRCQRLGIPPPEQIHYYIQGLPAHIRTHVILQQPTTLSQAENAAKIKQSVADPTVAAIHDVLTTHKTFLEQNTQQNQQPRTPPTNQQNQFDEMHAQLPNQRPHFNQRTNFSQRPHFNQRTNFNQRPDFRDGNLRQIIRQELQAFRGDRFSQQHNPRPNSNFYARPTHFQQNTNSSFRSRFNDRSNSNDRGPRSIDGRIICSFCKRTGHHISQCFQRNPPQARQHFQQRPGLDYRQSRLPSRPLN